ncbi:hypothetical protein [Spirabiliibacterium falconis]|uniref:hypothetical protein n=1 Tax=Spirabiliibacterium falconis TaxID=572023 RepID=UPI001AAC9547|nr:hypothetical protein [Spirabiliibacterium falconis]MBE2895155.1 hypothetical protein [Spirabiliibacterium falconis]
MRTAVKYTIAFLSLFGLVTLMIWLDLRSQSHSASLATNEYKLTAENLTNRTLLDEFHRRVDLSPPRYIVLPTQEKNELVLRYTLTTHSEKPIHSIEWLALYLYQGHIIFNKEIQIAFKSDSGNLSERNIDLVFPLDSISRDARTLFTHKDLNIKALTLPLLIQYADGSRLELSYK